MPKKENLLLSSQKKKKEKELDERLQASAKAEKSLSVDQVEEATWLRLGKFKVFNEERLDSMKSQLKKKVSKKAAAGTAVVVAYLINELLDDYEENGVDSILEGRLSGLEDFVGKYDKRYL